MKEKPTSAFEAGKDFYQRRLAIKQEKLAGIRAHENTAEFVRIIESIEDDALALKQLKRRKRLGLVK